MRNIAIRKDFSFFYVDPKEVESTSHDQKLDSLNRELKSLFAKYGIETAGGFTTLYDTNKCSIINCEKCGHLMINNLKSSENELVQDIQQVVCVGEKIEGKFICENCRLKSHR